MLARPIGPGDRILKWCCRNPMLASLTAVVVLALIGGISGIALQWRRAEAARKSALASDVESRNRKTLGSWGCSWKIIAT